MFSPFLKLTEFSVATFICSFLLSKIVEEITLLTYSEQRASTVDPHSLRSAKAEAANMVRKAFLRGDLIDPRGEASKALGLWGMKS